ncbi:MAG: hypothetical protein NT007_13065 [Candidatus Kapabacteria bacterium]|nr:hypothetical protein [Candidatus Kapabacteria bacterium]
MIFQTTQYSKLDGKIKKKRYWYYYFENNSEIYYCEPIHLTEKAAAIAESDRLKTLKSN